MYLEMLRLRAGYPTLQSFCDAYNIATGERMSTGTLSCYEVRPQKYPMCKQRLDNVSKFLKLSKFQKRNLESTFEKEKLRNHTMSSLPKSSPVKKKVRKKGYTFVKRASGKQPIKKVTSSTMPPGMNEAGNFLILVKERAPLLGNKLKDIVVLTALFMEANGVTTK